MSGLGHGARCINPEECGGADILARIIDKCKGDPKILILSLGNRPGGALPPRMVENWAKENHFTYDLYLSNPFDQDAVKSPQTHVEPSDAIANFIGQHKHELGKVVIFQQGHGDEQGCWKGGVTPEGVKQLTAGSEITIVTGCCYGGQWLKHFDGVTATSADDPARGDGRGGQFWYWLFNGEAFPNNGVPHFRGLSARAQHSAQKHMLHIANREGTATDEIRCGLECFRRLSVNDEMSTVLKVRCQGNVHRARLSEGPVTPKAIQDILDGLYPKGYVAKYQDDKNEMCTLCVDTFADFYALHSIVNGQRILRLEVFPMASDGVAFQTGHSSE